MSNQLAEALRLMLEDARHDRVNVENFNKAVDALAAHEAAKPAEPWGYANRRDGQAWSRVVLEGWHAHNMARYDLPLYAAPVAVASPWHPIETAPKDKLVLLFGAKRSEMVVGMFHTRDGWVIDTPAEWASMYTPSHWMPLPQAPKEQA